MHDDIKWNSKNGIIKLKDMDDTHLNNTIKLVNKFSPYAIFNNDFNKNEMLRILKEHKKSRINNNKQDLYSIW